MLTNRPLFHFVDLQAEVMFTVSWFRFELTLRLKIDWT